MVKGRARLRHLISLYPSLRHSSTHQASCRWRRGVVIVLVQSAGIWRETLSFSLRVPIAFLICNFLRRIQCYLSTSTLDAPKIKYNFKGKFGASPQSKGRGLFMGQCIAHHRGQMHSRGRAPTAAFAKGQLAFQCRTRSC